MSVDRVLSVSPRDAGVDAAESACGVLRQLVTIASDERDRLQSMLDRAAAFDVELSEALHQFEDRLSLGAQMLTALQHQIDRIECALEQAITIDQRNQALLASVQVLLEQINRTARAPSSIRLPA